MSEITEIVPDLLASDPSWPDVERVAKAFAAVLCETPEYQALEYAYLRLRDDEDAEGALRVFKERQRSIQPLLMLGAASDEQRAELERLREAWVTRPTVKEYLEAEIAMSTVCGEVGEILSGRIGLSFASACSPGCCG